MAWFGNFWGSFTRKIVKWRIILFSTVKKKSEQVFISVGTEAFAARLTKLWDNGKFSIGEMSQVSGLEKDLE